MSPTLFYWRGSGEVRSDVLAALRAVGYDVKVVINFEDILDLSVRRRPELIVVDASAGESEASVRVVELSGAQVLSSVPIVFISYQADKRSKVLKRQFGKFLPIDIPFTLPRFIEQLQTLCPSRPPTLAKGSAEGSDPNAGPAIELEEGDIATPVAELRTANPLSTDTTPTIEKSGDKPRVTKPPAGSRSRLLRVEDLPETMPSAIAHRNKLIQNLDPAQLSSGYGGATYCQSGTLGSIDDNILLPNLAYREVLLRALTEMTQKNHWLGQHARRVAFVSSALMNSMGASAERDMRLRAAAMLLNWGLRDKGQFMPTVDLFFPENLVFMPRVVEGFQVSAEFVREQLGDSETAEIISEIAAALSPENRSRHSDSRDITAVLVIELTDRAIWGNGKWDPFGAHRALRKLHEGTPIRVHRPLKQAVGRMLSEASSTRQFTKNYFPDAEHPADEAQRKAEAVEEAKKTAERSLNKHPQMNVQVFDLQPGMLLARPVVSWDGRVVLHANVVLDEDMIDHIWQLAMIRPIKPPLVIASPAARASVSDRS